MSRTVIDEGLKAEDLRPCQDYVIVRVVERTKTKSGILLPGNKQTPCRVGEVVSVGHGIPNNHDGHEFPINLKRGEHVLFMDYAGERMRGANSKGDGNGHGAAWENIRILREHGIWAKVDFESADAYEFSAIHPWAERILIERRDETMSRSRAIYLPKQELPLHWNIGTVVSVGFGCWHLESHKLLPCQTKPGESVIFRRYSGADVSLKGKELRLIQEVDVLGVVEED